MKRGCGVELTLEGLSRGTGKKDLIVSTCMCVYFCVWGCVSVYIWMFVEV